MGPLRPFIYVAGPISKDPFGCVAQAASVFQPLRAKGWVPFLPQWSVIHQMVDPVEYEDWMSYDEEVIRHCKALVRLAGESPGAEREVRFAQSLHIPVYYGEHAVPPTVPQGPSQRPVLSLV